jgi:hypothetical protein
MNDLLIELSILFKWIGDEELCPTLIAYGSAPQ